MIPDEVKRLSKAPLLSMGALWGMLIYQLQVTWTVNPQYSYGFLVPILCLFMLWRQGDKSVIVPDNSPSLAKKAFTSIAMILGCLSLFPLWVIREANSDWRLLNWAFAFIVIGITFTWLGRKNTFLSLKSYIYPTLFFLVSVPWPLAWDAEITLYLQNQATIFATEILWILGYPVEYTGNLIKIIGSGKVVSSVDEACSGIRGLQSSIVIALFLGFYYNFPIWIRLCFCILGVFSAFVINLIRVFALTYIGVTKGSDSIGYWHDPAGYTESIAIFICLFGIAVLLSKILKHNPDDEFKGNFKLFSFPKEKVLPTVVLIWALFILSINYVWYYQKETKLKPTPLIEIIYPEKLNSFESHSISDTVKAQLHYSQAKSATWVDPTTEVLMQGFYCRWKTSEGSPSILAIHRPDQCLGSRGLNLVKKYSNFYVNHLNFRINIEAYTFELHGQQLHVFRCIWPDKTLSKTLPGFPKEGYDLKGRIQAALDGKRNTGNRLIVFAIKKVENFKAAKEIAISQFQQSIQKI
jgi:exosortase